MNKLARNIVLPVLTALILAGTFFAVPAGAEEKKDVDWAAIFKNWDANKDGRLTREEWKGKADIFEKLDKNKDQAITKDEVGLDSEKIDKKDQDENSGSPTWDKVLKAWDKNGNKQIEKSEWKGKLEFEKVDLNKDSWISKKEFENLIDRDKKESGTSDEKIITDGRPDTYAVLLKKMDKNNDKRISRSEWTGNEVMFQIYDKDKNGMLTASEYDDVSRDYQANLDQGEDEFADLIRERDRNSDGKISESEFSGYENENTHQPVAFGSIDKNGDGFITSDEFAPWWAVETLKAQRGISDKK